MDNKKKIKALIMLGISMMSLSGCSTKEIKDKYKIIQEYNIDNNEDSNYYLVKAENDLIEGNQLKIIGSFETMDEAMEYLDSLDNPSEHNFGISEILGVILVGGFYYYCIRNYIKDAKKNKVLKK